MKLACVTDKEVGQCLSFTTDVTTSHCRHTDSLVVRSGCVSDKGKSGYEDQSRDHVRHCNPSTLFTPPLVFNEIYPGRAETDKTFVDLTPPKISGCCMRNGKMHKLILCPASLQGLLRKFCFVLSVQKITVQSVGRTILRCASGVAAAHWCSVYIASSICAYLVQ